MDNKIKKIILLSMLVIIFILLVVFICIEFFNKDTTLNMLLVNDSNESTVNNNVIEESIADKHDDIITDNNIVSDKLDNNNDVKKDNNDISSNYDNKDVYSEVDVVNYFESLGKEVDESSSFKDKFKEYFITIVDFIFYDKEINGYTFDELSGTARAKIISIALKMDSKIEEYVPNYKENISSTGNKIYTSIKDKLIVLYMDISTDICDNNKDECNKVKEIFTEIKDVCKIGWNFIKGLFKGGFSKVKDWYEIYSGK